MVSPPAHRSYELSLFVSRPVPDVSSVQARFHSRRGGFHVSTKGTMFQACLHPKGMPCRQSTLTTLQYHCQGRKRLIGGGSGCLDGQQWLAERMCSLLSRSGCRKASCCMLGAMLPKSDPMVPPPAKGSCVLSLSVSRPVPDVSSVQASFMREEVGSM